MARERLTPMDAVWLYFEKPWIPLHVGSLGIYDGRISFDALVDQLQSRIHTIPRYRQRVRFVPLNLGHPVWEDDPDFDLTRHVRRIRLRGKVGDARLRRVTSELFSPLLPRDRPLWDMTLIEGLSGGRSALLSRAHHCMVDGVSGLALLVAMLDFTATPRRVDPPPAGWAAPLPAPASELISDALWDTIAQQARLWSNIQMTATDASRPLRQLGTVARSLQKAGRFLLLPARQAQFNAQLQPPRAIAWTRTPFADVRAIRAAAGGTVNDVVLTVLAGALRHYLSAAERKRLEELRVLIPVNVRTADQQGMLGTRISFMLGALPLQLPDPMERLALIRGQMQELKRVRQAEGVDILAQILGDGPAPVAAAAGSLLKLPNTITNLVCTNVPGPMVPLYCVGRRLLEHYPFAPISWNMGINVGVMSYDQDLFWGLVANEPALPNLERLTGCVEQSFAELMKAAGLRPAAVPRIDHGAPPATAATRPRRRRAGAGTDRAAEPPAEAPPAHLLKAEAVVRERAKEEIAAELARI